MSQREQGRRARLRLLSIALACMLALSAAVATGAPVEMPPGSKCHACGMTISVGGAFEAQVIQDGRVLGFCDIGDMLHFYGGLSHAPEESFVRDYNSKAWVAARDAFYVKDRSFSSPMGWDIAAFASAGEARKAGSPISFDEAVGEVRK